jgi:hypothetical protein
MLQICHQLYQPTHEVTGGGRVVLDEADEQCKKEAADDDVNAVEVSRGAMLVNLEALILLARKKQQATSKRKNRLNKHPDKAFPMQGEGKDNLQSGNERSYCQRGGLQQVESVPQDLPTEMNVVSEYSSTLANTDFDADENLRRHEPDHSSEVLEAHPMCCNPILDELRAHGATEHLNSSDHEVSLPPAILDHDHVEEEDFILV